MTCFLFFLYIADIFKKTIFLFYVYQGFAPQACSLNACGPHTCSPKEARRGHWISLELELQMDVGNENQTLLLCNSSKCSALQNTLSSPTWLAFCLWAFKKFSWKILVCDSFSCNLCVLLVSVLYWPMTLYKIGTTSSLTIWQNSSMNYPSLEGVFEHVFDYEFKFLSCKASQILLFGYMPLLSSYVFSKEFGHCTQTIRIH